MKVQLTQGKTAHVDNEDFLRVSKFKWFAQKVQRRWYAASDQRKLGGRYMLLHQFIFDFNFPEIDHKNGDGLNCRRSNLRPCTRQQNLQAFQRPIKNKTSRFRGVCWHSQSGSWRAYIKLNRTQISLGLFGQEIKAARAYDAAARKYFGEFACPNLK